MLSHTGAGESAACPVVREEEWEEKRLNIHAEEERGYKVYFRQKI